MFSSADFDAADLADRKADQGLTVTVALPALDEAATIGPIVTLLRERLMGQAGLIDELLVIDDGSTDGTGRIATEAGATVHAADSIHPEYGSGGKGEALWKSLSVSSGDLVIWCDADITNYDERFVLGVAGPLLTDPAIGFVKGFYRRPLNADGEGGGRVTELVARPLIATLFPALGHLVQPLSGEFGGRRSLLQAIPFHRGYAVDLAMLIDLTQRFGADVIAQVDLGARLHRNRPLRQLGPQAAAITAMALEKAGVGGTGEAGDVPPPWLAVDETKPGRLVMARPEFGDAIVPTGVLPPVNNILDQELIK
jgi:glucosyl-3-phosphoglycerate synthase